MKCLAKMENVFACGGLVAGSTSKVCGTMHVKAMSIASSRIGFSI